MTAPDRRCAMCGEPCTGGRHTIAGFPEDEEFHMECLRPISVATAEAVIAIMKPDHHLANAADIERRCAEWDERYYGRRRAR